MSALLPVKRSWPLLVALLCLCCWLPGCMAGGGCGDGSCQGNDGNCYSCSNGLTCSTSGGSGCSAPNHGTYCCNGTTGTNCGCGTLCNSNGYCCAQGSYGCNGRCYGSYNDMLSAGCSSVKTCCP